MLKKKERLTKKEFDRFFASGARKHSTLLTAVISSHTEFHGAVVVGKKVYRKAVDRNRLRRRLYSVLYRLSRDQGLKGVYIILTKPPAATASFTELKDALASLIPKS